MLQENSLCVGNEQHSGAAPTRGADKSLARPGRKQATATEDFEFHISYFNHNWRNISIILYIYIYTQVSQEECARLREGVPYVKVYRYNPKRLCPKLNGYGDKDARKVWSSCGSTYCNWFAWRNTHTLRIVRPCLQPAQGRSLLRLHM